MTVNIDLFYSFRSPYSYLATPGANALMRDFDVQIRFRTVLPQAIRNPGFFSPANHEKVRYILMDWQRRAEMLGLPHDLPFPSPDPVVQNLETFEIAEEQPYIYRLCYFAIAAEMQGRGLAFATEVSRLIFGGTKDWHLGSHLSDAVGRAGLSLDELEKQINDRPQKYQDALDVNQTDHNACGQTGVPVFVYDGKPFFGQDRIDTLAWTLARDGLGKQVKAVKQSTAGAP